MRKRIKAIILIASIVMNSGIAQNGIPCKAAETELDNYVVMAENGKELVSAVQTITGEDMEKDDIINSNPDSFSSMIVDLDKSEVSELKKEGLVVEENISFDAYDMETEEVNETGYEYKQPIYEWNIGAVRADEYIHDEAKEKKIKVAILDSGVNYHPDIPLKNSISIIDTDMSNSGAILLCDTTGHGTSIASLITGRSGSESIQGMNQDAELYSVQVLGEENRGRLGDIINGIYWCIDNDIDIINMSFGTMNDSEILHNAVIAAKDAGILMVAAAGNKGSDSVAYPARYKEVISVGSTDMTGSISEFSAYGTDVDIYAPGENIVVDGPLLGVQIAEGTSIACAEVSAAASIIWESNPELDADEIRQKLINGSNPNISVKQPDDRQDGNEAGLLDVEGAMNDNLLCNKNNEVTEKKTSKPIPVYDEDEVEALFHSSASSKTIGHKDMVPSAEEARGYRLMRAASMFPDSPTMYTDHGEVTNPLNKCRLFHGRYDYWETISFLVDYAHALYSKDDAKIKEVRNAANNSCIGKKRSGHTYVLNAIDNYLKNELCFKDPDKSHFYVDVKENTYPNRAYKVIGVAIHTIGDAYAHSTLITDNHVIYFKTNYGSYLDFGKLKDALEAAKPYIKKEARCYEAEEWDDKIIKATYFKISDYTIKNSKINFQDDYNIVPDRYKCASDTVYSIVANNAAYDFRKRGWGGEQVLKGSSMLRKYRAKSYKDCEQKKEEE